MMIVEKSKESSIANKLHLDDLLTKSAASSEENTKILKSRLAMTNVKV